MRCAMARCAARCADMIEFLDGQRASVCHRKARLPASLRQVRQWEGGMATGAPCLAGAANCRRCSVRSAARAVRRPEDRPRSPRRTAWHSTVPANPCGRADACRARIWRPRHRRGASHADPPASRDASAGPHAAAEYRQAHAWRTDAPGMTRHRRQPGQRRARARKTDRAGRQTIPLWHAPASSGERTWRQTNAVSRSGQGVEGAAPSHLHAQYRGIVA